jgi:two-component system chemotaxis response regulator CheB
METTSAVRPAQGGKVRVLVVDDSAVARDLIMRGLSLDPEIEVVGQAADAWAARDAIIHLSPDVVTLDVEMPRMDGIDFLRRLMPQYPLPVVIVSAVTAEGSRRALEALEAGALEVVGKPAASDREGLRDMLLDLAEKVKAAAKADHAKLRPKAGPPAPRPNRPAKPARRPAGADSSGLRPGPAASSVIAIGASTGGTAALMKLLAGFPEDCPPTLVVQHMPPVFTAMFAASLDRTTAPTVREAVDAQRLERGLVLVGAGDRQLRLEKDQRGFYVRSAPGPKVSGHCPSVDVLFESVAKAAGPRGVGLLLTGMGRDGADGLLSMRRAGGRCLAQDEASSVVFGMPQEAWRNGAAERLLPLDRAAAEVLACAARIDQDAAAWEAAT